MDIVVHPDHRLTWNGHTVPCALGRAGIRPDKREGDGATPAGTFALRRVYYRADRLPARPSTGLPVTEISRDLGWCDDPAHPEYNRPVRLPFPASHEEMWRDDALYDLVVVVGHNDDPVVPGAGSAVFLHVARPNYSPTAGCVALSLPDLTALVGACRDGQRIHIGEPRP